MPETILYPTIFRAYDIRGLVGISLTTDVVFLIGKAFGSFVRDSGEHQVTIARDGRASGPAFVESLSNGILSVGCDVIDIGMVPTPLLYYATHKFNEHSGVMITGSHNPPEYNGLKMVLNGKALTEIQIKELYKRIREKAFYVGHGVKHELPIVERYTQEIVEGIQLARPLKIVIDAGNGVTGAIAPELFRKLGCEVHELFCDVDATFPNHHPDPSYPENLKDLAKKVIATQSDVGLAFDGDGDRLGVVTSSGKIIWPDRLLILYAQALLKRQPGSSIIYDVKCTAHLDDAIRKAEGCPIMWRTGHSMIKNKMLEMDAKLAGEMSGHFFFKDRWYGFDDALYAAARLLEILSSETGTSEEIFNRIPNSVNTPEIKVPVPDEEKFYLMEQLINRAHFPDAKTISKIDGLRVNFLEGWGLIRPSNTSPYLILRFEADDETILDKIQLMFRDWILSVRPNLVLPF